MVPAHSCVIRFTRGCRAGGEVRLSEGETTIGRSTGNDIVLPGIMVSRNHARLLLRSSGLAIEDRNSRYGTLVNGRPIRERMPLEFGDRVQLGNQEIEILPAIAPQELDATQRRRTQTSDGMTVATGDGQIAAKRGERSAWTTRPGVGRGHPVPIRLARIPETIAVMAVLLAEVMLGMLRVEPTRARTASETAHALKIVPAGWVVDSRFANVDESGATNEIVLVFTPGEVVP